VHIRKAIPLDASAIARVHVDSWRTTYRGIIPESYLKSLSYDQRANQWKNSLDDENYFVCVAEEDFSNQIVGFASGGPDRSKDVEYTGELGAIYLLEDYRRKGIGQKLVLLAIVRKLLEQGHHSMIV
jgi:GNAT superfamily N-acetyltransferase